MVARYRIGHHKHVKRAAMAVSVTGAALLWYILTDGLHVIPRLFLPSPSDLLSTLAQVRANLLSHSFITFGRVTISFIAGSCAGCLTGLLMSRFAVVYGGLNPLIEALRPIPPIALIPFFILWFGIGAFGKVLLAGLGCFMVMVVATTEAVRNVPPIYLDAAETLGAHDAYAYRTIVVPAIIPELIGASRVALALAFGLMIAAELMGAQAGLGFMIMVARRNLNTSTILLGIIVIGFEARVADRALSACAAWLTRWSERNDGE